jgi:hypothetical protein
VVEEKAWWQKWKIAIPHQQHWDHIEVVTFVLYKNVKSSNFNFDYKKIIDCHKRIEIEHVLGCIIWNKCSIYLINSRKNIMTKLKPFKERIHSIFLCMLGTWMLKVIQFTKHLRKKFKMIMKNFNNRTMWTKLKIPLHKIFKCMNVKLHEHISRFKTTPKL